MQKLSHVISLISLIMAWAVIGNAQPTDPGSIGGACLSENPTCVTGVCDSSIGICVPCGMPGEAACQMADGQLDCYLTDWGYAPGAAGQLPICVNDTIDDCGQVGAAACLRNGQPYCYYGVLTGAAGSGQSYCAACGDIGQACCLDTVYDCDYGTCQSGKCLPSSSTAQDQISAAIQACRFPEAQQLIDTSAGGASLQADLDKAMAREDRVRILFEASRDIAREARADSVASDPGNAALKFHAALDRLQRARALSQCAASLLVLDEGIAMTERNIKQTHSDVALAEAESAIGLCLFDQAQRALGNVIAPTEQHDILAQRLTEAKAREARVLQIYTEAQALNVTGKQQLANDQFEQALLSFNAAHRLITQAQQLTNCTITRAQIDDALARVGRNILLAADGPPEVTDPSVGIVGPITNPTAAHPCLDLDIPVDYMVSGYRRYIGGGGTAWMMKGPYICGFEGTYSTLTAAEMVAFVCDVEGGQYSNCRETKRTPVDSWEPVDDGITYRFNNGDFWIVLHPME